MVSINRKEKFMKKIKKVWNNFKKIIEKSPVTIVTILIVTTLNAIGMENGFISNKILDYITSFGFFLAITTFLTETILKDNSKKKYLLYILGGAISLALTYLTTIDNEILESLNLRIIACYCISLITLSIYFNYKNSKRNFNEYVTQVFINLFKASIIYGILAIGVSIITSIFVFLILDNSNYMLVVRLETLVFGFFYLPKIINSFYQIKKENSKFIIGIIKYVLEPLVIIAFIIIYLYIIKILVFRDIPSNQIFRILTTLFILGCPIWTMASSLKEKNILDKINKKLPLLYIPFIFLQIYSVGVRILSNGITEARYLCMMFILFEIIYIVIYIIKKEKISNSLFTIIILTVISTIVPYINISKASILSQYHNLKIYKQKSEYTKEEKEKIYGAYYYLKYKEGGKKYLEELLNKEDIEKIRNFKINNPSYSNTKYIYANLHLDHIDISGYKKLKFISIRKYKEITDNEFKEISFEIENSEENITLDLSKSMEGYIKNRDDLTNYLENHNKIEIDSNKKVIITKISFRYNETNNQINNYSISGYLLEK